MEKMLCSQCIVYYLCINLIIRIWFYLRNCDITSSQHSQNTYISIVAVHAFYSIQPVFSYKKNFCFKCNYALLIVYIQYRFVVNCKVNCDQSPTSTTLLKYFKYTCKLSSAHYIIPQQLVAFLTSLTNAHIHTNINIQRSIQHAHSCTYLIIEFIRFFKHSCTNQCHFNDYFNC